uniref:Serpin B6 n=1 Tax=Labrus bergylta TaxID=56723 RepID=A0A3Q3GX88_9LABR
MDANSTFSLDLFKKLSDDDKTANIFYSPLSISSALAMVMLGARANTAAQMSELQFLDLMSFTTNYNTDLMIHLSLFGELLSELNKEDAPYALSVANRLYGEKSYRFNKEYIADTKKHYSAELKSVDFKKKAEEARVHINDWVEKNTQGKIKDLLAEGAVDDSTRLALINAVYFKGTWDQQFKEQDTVEYQFRVNKVTEEQLSFALSVFLSQKKLLEQKMFYKMKNKQILKSHASFQSVAASGELGPNENTGAQTSLEMELTHQKFVDWSRPDMMDQGTVEVKLPRFKLEETYELNNVLKKMGMLDAFDVSMSDFSGMSLANDLFLSKVVHKAFVDPLVPSYGIRSVDIPFTFIADHPFLFFIKHIPTKTTLFAGRYCSPE